MREGRTYANCPECNYSAEPDEVLGQDRKHFHPHSLRCVRCGYTTETKATWVEATRAWNKTSAAATARDLKQPLTTGDAHGSK